MSNLVKKMTSVFAGAAVVLSAVAPIAGVNAAYTSVDAANKLATLGVIVDQSANPADYLLGNEITRRELAKITMNLSSVEVMDVCNGLYSDLPSSDWGCKYAEAGQNAGFFAANPEFRADASVSKWEVLKNVMKARGIEKGDDTDFRKGYVDGAVAAWIISESFTDYDTAAVRGWIFQVSADAVDSSEDDGLGSLFDDLLGGLDDDDDTNTDDGTGPVVTGGNVVVSLSPDTPTAATIPGAISGLPVAKFDFTAGNTDVTLTSLTVKRRGLSNSNTLSALAVFTDDGRASKAKDDSQENNTEARLVLTNPGIVIKAGETRTVTVVADVRSATVAAPNTNGDEFAIELVDVVASGDIDGVSNLVANTMRVGWVDAANVVVKADGSVSNVKVGANAAEIFKFKIEWANDEDVILKKITFKGEGSVSEDSELMNYKLELNGNILATTEYGNGKYVTFDLGDGFTIAEGQNERFKVLADVVAWVNETIAFKIDKNLDVTAIGQKYGFGASIDITAVDDAVGTLIGTNELGVISIDAGELSLSDIDAPFSKIRADKDAVVLGSVEITNVSGAPLELQALLIDATLNAASFIDDGAGVGGIANDGTKQAGESLTTLDTVFENFEVKFNNTSYDLSSTNGNTMMGSYGDNDLTVPLPEGVTTMVITADTKKHVSGNTIVNLSINNIGAAGFKAVEIDEETTVTDITPSSLTFKQVEFITAGAKLSAVPLANATVVRGSKNVVANQFNIKAEEASLVEIDEVKAKISGYMASAAQVDTITFAGVEDNVGAANEVLTTTITDAGGTSTFTTTVQANTAATAASTVVSAVTTNVTGVSTQTYTVAENLGVVTVTGNTAGVAFSTSTAVDQTDPTPEISVASSVNTTIASIAVLAAEANKVIASAALYHGSVSDANLIKSKWGSNIDATGVVTFDSFNKDVMISANTTDTFIVVLTLVDGVDAVGKLLTINGVGAIVVTATDDDGDDIIVTWTAPSAKVLTVTNSGNVVLAYDVNNTPNKEPKTILGWTSRVVASYDVQSQNEATDVETVKVSFADLSGDMNLSLLSARLLLNGVEVATANNEDYNSWTKELTFDTLTALIIPKASTELEVEITTSTIGFEKVGKSIAGETVTNIVLSDVRWVSSGKSVASKSDASVSKAFNIVDVKVTASVIATLADGTAKLRLTADAGDNTQALSESTPVVNMVSLTFIDNGAWAPLYKVYEEGEAPGAWFAAINAGANDTEVAKISFTSDVIVNILPQNAPATTYALELNKNGVAYNTTLTNNATTTLSLGTKTID